MSESGQEYAFSAGPTKVCSQVVFRHAILRAGPSMVKLLILT